MQIPKYPLTATRSVPPEFSLPFQTLLQEWQFLKIPFLNGEPHCINKRQRTISGRCDCHILICISHRLNLIRIKETGRTFCVQRTTIAKSTADTQKPSVMPLLNPFPTRSVFRLPHSDQHMVPWSVQVLLLDRKEISQTSAAVTPAITVAPNPLTAAWITRVPIAVIEILQSHRNPDCT